MNQTEKKAFIKRELAALENEELLFQQCLSSITSRKRYLKLELVELGVSSSAPRGRKYDGILSDEQKLKLTAGLTK
jgi:hypothetical protein